MTMFQIDLSPDDAQIIDQIVNDLDARYDSVEDPDFLDEAVVRAHELPGTLRSGLARFKLREHAPVCRVSGWRFDDASIGRTPGHWNDREAVARTRRQDFYLQLASHLLGETVAWATEQGAHMVHEVLPIAGNEGGQLGTSTDQLYWHTEDAFHPERMDYVALLCLRNHDRVATTYASVDDLDLDAETRFELFRPAYPFLPDEGNRAEREMSAEASGLALDLAARGHAQVQRMYHEPELVPALFGSEDSPYIRVHPHYIADFGDDVAAAKAFDRLKDAVNNALRDIVLAPGDLFFIDNFKAVHGRREIPGRFDGTDRWLKRSFIVRDLRKTRALRVSSQDRVVY
ncbi:MULTISPECIES: guanitoxin biosynthesis L-enduracididine beta-hydroxylase GntD [unclassified Streptomyces]|uniref:guanitoxin biosynthesis L-enduracididine beta-hydroxylase GntD n=1 Tax=unclassified Streptomyces TaxID=2593676 RepID=UPI0022B602CB|nr:MULTISPECIES: guanitoxin biosynthesis L-enduracididine beta-hydroxylase GntD [unclassified Streptomyces]MCZ7416244.1 guanitoxin biosynthesis L-enduracididine beta-hydroxylase GntD [Streptomyces sp. WMMC897]MCZ7433946.1 guanitoxin biosynthesis L-enduracididine beta-hydroxylase GntD [Streptomyces sp. WMMC1477]